MCLLFESIRCENGLLCNIEYHNNRINNSRRVLYGVSNSLFVQDIIPQSEIPNDGIYKCRLTYDNAEFKYEFVKYSMRTIRSVKIVTDDSVSYEHKYSDRGTLSALVQNSGVDEIIIVKNGLVTDTSFSNILFFDGEIWFTPNTPLLKGTQRQKLLDESIVTEKTITADDISKYVKIRLINAMIPFEAEYDIGIDRILK